MTISHYTDEMASAHMLSEKSGYGRLSKSVLNKIAVESAQLSTSGSVASYIPELARVNQDLFSISCAENSGKYFEAGDTEHEFTMQSISKIFALGLAIEKIGAEGVFDYVGMEPSADSFNSLMRLEITSPKPSNPFLNSGAIMISSLLHGKYGTSAFDEVCSMVEAMTGTYRGYDENVYISENSTADRNRALAYFMKSMGFLRGDVEDFLQLYFKCCSILCTTKDLANAALTLAECGHNMEGRRLIQKETVYTLLGLMSACGLYNGSGEFAVKVGLSGKSAVSGGILAVAPGYMGIGVFSPALDSKGNSVAGVSALAQLSDVLNLRGLGKN